jgi:UDP-D-galactose:(glucosyl)LPS alpha-1,6-D-galactosyltransferase
VSGQGGVETVLTSVANELSQQGHRVIIFLPDASDNSDWEKRLPEVHYYFHPVVPIGNRLELIAEKARSFAFVLANFETPDILIGTHVPHTVFYARMAAGYSQPRRTVVISWLHNPPTTFFDPHLIHYADIHLAISKGIQQDIKNLVNASRPVFWVGNPIAETPQRIDASDEQQYVVISRLENKQKRLDVLFKALAQLTFPWHLRIFGSGSDEEMLKTLASQLGISNHIQWEGWVTNPWERILRSTALILTSDFEGMPMSIGEAMARGLPVISSDCHTGPKDLVEHGNNGFLFHPGDAVELAACFEHIANLTDQQRMNMSEAALNTASQHYVKQVLNRWKQSLIDFIPEERWHLQ